MFSWVRYVVKPTLCALVVMLVLGILSFIPAVAQALQIKWVMLVYGLCLDVTVCAGAYFSRKALVRNDTQKRWALPILLYGMLMGISIVVIITSFFI